jgi:hypothetical protein
LNKTVTYLLFLCLLLPVTGLFSQTLSGFVQDENNAPIPFATIYVKNISVGARTDGEGKYFIQFPEVGMYEIVVTSVGYNTQETKVIFEVNKDIVKNFWMETNQAVLDELVVNSKRRDPAYGIISSAIEQKNKWDKQYNSSTSNVYIKAKEIISEKEKKKREKEKEQEEKNKDSGETKTDEDIFAAQEQERKSAIYKVASGMNMVEAQIVRHFEYPNKVKEVREGYKEFGRTFGLFYTRTSEADFNFYDNLMSLDKLNELPVVSPLNTTSILTYRFKLEETTYENDRAVYKIKVTPRKQGNASWEGYIWIMDKSFNIKKVELSLDKSGLYIYNSFTIKQSYSFNSDSLILLQKEEFDYSSKGGGNVFTGNTIVTYSDYKINPIFEKRFFKNEVAVTTQDAYDKDSTYWEYIRPDPLTIEEQDFQRVKDSIKNYMETDVYLDSVDSVFNRVTLIDVMWDGIGFSNRKKKQYLFFNSIIGMTDPFEIGGLRLGQDLYYFKKYKNEKFFSISPSVDIGLRNKDIKYDFSFRARYDPMHAGYIGLWTGKLFNTIVENDAISNIFVRANWIEEQRLTLYTSREVLNGLYLFANLSYIDRFPIDKYEFGQITEDWFDGNEPLLFQNYQTTIATFTLQFTPYQKYMTEPNRKVVLGSRWPTFSIHYERGVPELLGSDIDFSYGSINARQDIKVGTLGTSSYSASFGKFLNTTDLRYVDNIIYPRGDKWFFASLLESMQLQDTTLTVSDQYYRINYRHHFNGAVINYVPFVKKLGIHAVVGASTIYIKESDYRYIEGYVGIERSFKAERARYRLGVFFVMAESNYGNITPRLKFSFNRYNLRDQSWGY